MVEYWQPYKLKRICTQYCSAYLYRTLYDRQLRSGADSITTRNHSRDYRLHLCRVVICSSDTSLLVIIASLIFTVISFFPIMAVERKMHSLSVLSSTRNHIRFFDVLTRHIYYIAARLTSNLCRLKL